MTVYPADSYNTFVDVATADARLSELGATAWAGKTTEEKEQMLVMSGSVVIAHSNINGQCNYATAQVMLIFSDLVNGGKFLSGVDGRSKYTKAKVGSLAVEFNHEATALPAAVSALLSRCLKNGYTVTGFDIA